MFHYSIFSGEKSDRSCHSKGGHLHDLRPCFWRPLFALKDFPYTHTFLWVTDKKNVLAITEKVFFVCRQKNGALFEMNLPSLFVIADVNSVWQLTKQKKIKLSLAVQPKKGPKKSWGIILFYSVSLFFVSAMASHGDILRNLFATTDRRFPSSVFFLYTAFFSD